MFISILLAIAFYVLAIIASTLFNLYKTNALAFLGSVLLLFISSVLLVITTFVSYVEITTPMLGDKPNGLWGLLGVLIGAALTLTSFKIGEAIKVKIENREK